MAEPEPEMTASEIFEYQHIATVYHNDRGDQPLVRGLAYLMFEVFDNGTVYQTFVHNGVLGELPQMNSSGAQPGAAGVLELDLDGHLVWVPQQPCFSFLGLRGTPHHRIITPFSKKGITRLSMNKYLAVHTWRTARNGRPPIQAFAPWAVLN